MRKLISVFFLMLLISCEPGRQEVKWPLVEALVNHGNFRQAAQLIDSLKQSSRLSAVEAWKLDSLQDMMHRIRLDFSKSEQQIRQELQPYYGTPDDFLMTHWEQTGKLEMKVIDGEKRYFARAVPNLFRLDPAARWIKLDRDGGTVDSLNLFRLKHLAEVIRAAGKSFDPVLPVSMELTYTVRVKPDVVPAGEMISCWMPVPREGNPRQKNFRLLSTEPDSFRLAPNDYLQRTVFLQKKTVAGEPVIFQVRFAVETAAQYFDLQPEQIKPYNTGSELYRTYTAERPPQLVFTPEIKALAGKIVGDETNPLEKVRKIYTWISDSIPWASALEYCTMNHIPGYVIQNGHGDCGMQTLLFMSLARAEGIPARWQSGWMLHPSHVNLHDWCEVYYEGVGWVPVDQSFKLQDSNDQRVREFYVHGIDSYRLIVNDDYGQELYPPKKYWRSEPYDFQRGELEWSGGNLYFDKWNWNMEVKYN